MKEIIVIGSGIVGSFIAHTLSMYDVHVTIIEKHNDICEEVSAANSAIVHAGYDPLEGTLKARLNKRGADMYPDICKRLHVDLKRCGAYVVACGEEEEAALEQLYQRGEKRGVRVQYIDLKDAIQKEPHLSTHVTKVMEVEDTAIIMPWEVCNALVDECLLNNGTLVLNEEVIDIKIYDQHGIVTTNKQSYKADIIINAAGLGAQKLMEMVEDTPLFTITPKRGQYFILSKHAKNVAHQVIYPVPGSIGKGVLAIPTTHGNILLGPNSEVLHSENNSTTSYGLQDVKKHLSKTLQNVPFQEVIHTYSGLRPTGNNNDFFIDHATHSKRFIHCACIDSPGLASAPAIAEYVIDEFVLPVVHIEKKEMYHERSSDIRLHDCTIQERNEIISKQKAYGHMICRCEEISEQEVVDCIHRPCGARSIKGVKKRVRPGMGKCQGGFCEIEIANILARELDIPLHEVMYDNESYFMEVKGVTR